MARNESSLEMLRGLILTRKAAKAAWSELMLARSSLIESLGEFSTQEEFREAVKRNGMPMILLVNNIAWKRLEEYWLQEDKVKILLKALTDPDEIAVMHHLYFLETTAEEAARVCGKPMSWTRKVQESAIKHLDEYLESMRGSLIK